MVSDVLFSSKDTVWATPMDLFAKLNKVFNFELDVCATPDNAKCNRFFTEADDGLKQNWAGVCWMNPPYGKTIKEWVKKAYDSAQAGATVGCLLPARTCTSWWHEYCEKGGHTRSLRGVSSLATVRTARLFLRLLWSSQEEAHQIYMKS